MYPIPKYDSVDTKHDQGHNIILTIPFESNMTKSVTF